MARPLSAKNETILALVDGQIFIEQAIAALRLRDTERALRCMSLARESQKQAAGEIEGIGDGRFAESPKRHCNR
jgi:hypothetical protein